MGNGGSGNVGRVRARRVTSTDVAVEAGVSQATVARVFSSPDLVADGTRRSVRATAERLGYTPNAIARSLKQQRSGIVGAVVPARGEYWQHVLTSFSRHLADAHKQLLLFSISDVDAVDDVLATVDQFRVDGLVLASAHIGTPQLSRASLSSVPVVAFNQPVASGLTPSVSVDNRDGMRQLVEHALAVGCRSVRYVGGDHTMSTDQLRYLAATQHFADYDIACPYLAAGAFDYDAGHRAAERLLAEPLPDLVMVTGDELALGVIDGLRRAGVSVPGDVAVTGFDGLPQASWAGYDLTTVAQPIDTLVAAAVELLLDDDLVARHAAGDVPDHVVPGQLRIGATTLTGT